MIILISTTAQPWVASLQAVFSYDLSLDIEGLLSNAVLPPRCTVCEFPDWNKKITGKARSGEINSSERMIEKYESLQSSIQSNCPGCILLHEAWAYCIPDERTRSGAWMTFNIDTTKMYFHLFHGGVHDIDIFTLPDQPRLKHISCSSLIPSDTRLEDNLPRIRLWIEACEKAHKKCSEATDFTPLRLLDLQTGSETWVQLVSVVDVRYACLSHCWGSTRSKHLTRRDNLTQNEKGIPLTELPKTFQDAVEITRALGIRYLWIDTFCIIQDDEKDWETQASLMAATYENAYITLAAGASDDDDGGFFTEACDRHTKPHKFHLNVDGITHEVYMRCTMAEGPFNSREDPDIMPPKLPGCEPLKYQCSRLNDLSSNEIASLWRELVIDYSTRNLTKPSDKLPALAGLANKFQRVIGSSYLAGLWLKNLREDLAWHAYGDEESPGRVRKGPSWTWAAAGDLRIEWSPLDLHSTFQVEGMSFHGDIQGFNPDSDVEGRYLRISGNLLPVSIRTYTERESFEEAFPLARHCQVVEWSRRHSQHSQLIVQRNGSLVSPAKHDPRDRSKEVGDCRSSYMHGTFFADYRFWETDEELRESLQHTYFLLLGIEPDTDPFWIAGMVLKPRLRTWAESEGLYERIGWLRYCTLNSVQETEWVPQGTAVTLKLV
ncbi:het-domain-containing protein [Fusarium flagelliforme]|uniref:Het-domain-containing protein n=1 Tax=Fusarium flagelliforme TaxID=2675880 RepID=A0A395N0F8_9HYPO|nr:het-domain-containing protein [Fusarium flagelliforme]